MNIILRPERNERTPRALSEALGPAWSTRRWPGYSSGTPDFDRDFFMIYPELDRVNTLNRETYAQLRNYYQKNKPNQRLALGEMGLPIPATFTHRVNASHSSSISGRYVVRPLRHEGGQEYRVTNRSDDFREGEEYISELFPKEREYRLLYVFGELTGFWQKKKVEGETDDGPWGAEGHSSFAAISDWANSYLFRHTDAQTVIGNTFVARNSHIVAFDVLYSHTLRRYVVLETNVCPALYWSPTAITKVVERIQARPDVRTQQQPRQVPIVPETRPVNRPIESVPVTNTAPPVQRQTLRQFTVALPPRAVIETYTIDLLGHTHELTRAEVQHVITGLQRVIQ